MKLRRKLFFVQENGKASLLGALINFFLVMGLFVAIFWLSLGAINVHLEFGFLGQFRWRLWDGFCVTVAISAGSLVFSLLIGILSAAGCSSSLLFVRYFCGIYVKFMRGTPLIMQIYLFFYIVGTAWGVENRFVAGVIILSVFEGAYISEIIRGSLLSLEESQLEAAKAVGFTRCQTLRYVILPQLVTRTLPALTGQFASIIKDSSLLSMIAVIELTQTIREITAVNFRMFECYLLLGLMYLCLTLPISFISRCLERRFQYEN